MYLGLPCYGYAFDCHLVYLAIPGTRPLCMKSKICLCYLYSIAKSEIQMCLNKHKRGLVLYLYLISRVSQPISCGILSHLGRGNKYVHFLEV